MAGAVPGSGHAAVAEVAVGADWARLGTALRVPETVWHVHVAMFSEREGFSRIADRSHGHAPLPRGVLACGKFLQQGRNVGRRALLAFATF